MTYFFYVIGIGHLRETAYATGIGRLEGQELWSIIVTAERNTSPRVQESQWANSMSFL